MENAATHTTPLAVMEITVSAVDIPQEVADLVVDILAHDPKSLKSSSLISRQWRPRSQYHLHHTLRLTRQSDIPFLDSVYSDALLASYVRSLDIETMWDPFWNTLLPVLRKLDSVRSLTLTSVGGINLEMHAFMAGQFASLNSLVLSFVTFENFTAFSNFLNAFPALTKLEMKNVYWTRSEGELTVASVHRFHELRIAYCTEQPVLVKWLMGAGEKLRLESLTLTWYAKSDGVREFMHFLGEHLRHLTFSYVFSDAFSRGKFFFQIAPRFARRVDIACSDWKENPLDLASNTNLRTIEFLTNVMLPYVWGHLPTIPEMLSTVVSPHLSTLGVHMANLDEEPVPSACLFSIDGIMSQPHFRSLSAMNLYAEVNTSLGTSKEQMLERIQSTIHSAMPNMLKRGVLHVEPSGK